MSDDIKPVAWYWNTADWKGVSFGVDAAPDGVEPQPLYPAAAIEALRAERDAALAREKGLREAMERALGALSAADCPGLERPTDFAIAQARAIKIGFAKKHLDAALAAQEADRAPGSPGEPKTSV